MQLDDLCQQGFLRCLQKPAQNGCMKPTSRNSIPRVFFRFALMKKVEKNAFSMQLDDLCQQGFLRCLEKPTQNGGMKPTSWNSIPRVFVRFAPMGKVQKTRFQRNWTTFINKGFCAVLKRPQNGGMKPTSWNSIPRVFFRFALMEKVEKTRFECNWMTFLNKGFYADWKSPPKMVV